MVLDHARDQSGLPHGFGRVPISREHHLPGSRETNARRKPGRCAAAGKQSVFGVRISEPGIAARNDEVAAKQDFETASQRPSLNAGYYWHWASFQLYEDLVQARGEGSLTAVKNSTCVLPQLLQVGP